MNQIVTDAQKRMDEILRAAELPGQLRLAPMDLESWKSLAEPLLAEVFLDRRYIALSELYGDEAVARANILEKAGGALGVFHRYGFWDGDRLIGVYRGRQGDAAVYRMTVTAFRADWQRRGVYGAFLPAILEAAAAVGFLQVVSTHHADNNPILIAKLSVGFVIAGLKVSLRTGLMVELVYRFGEQARAHHRLKISG